MTPDQKEALSQLWAITASESSSDKERDERLLRENNWDVQRTVELIFMEGNSAPGPSKKETFEIEEPPFRPRRLSGAQRRTGGGVGLGIFGLLTWPFSTVISILRGTWYFFIRTFLPLSFLPHLPQALLPPSGASRPQTRKDPTATSLAYVQHLETVTGCSSAAGTLPDFYVGPYREFVNQVRKQGRIGVVVLMCGEHEDNEEFKKDVLCDEEFVRCLKEKEMLVWAADIRSREGYQVAQTLITTTYPSLTFLSLLPPPPNTSTSPKLSILTTLSGPPSTTTSTSSILQTITNSILPRVSPFLARLKRERMTLEEARHLREEQDRAFREAEKRDREKMRKQKDFEEMQRIVKEREEKEAKEKEDLIKTRQAWRRYARKHLLPSSTGQLRVSLRTPLSSERNIRQFSPGPSTLSLFIYAETLLIPSTDSPEDDPDSPPEGFEPPWDFRIVTSYPRKEIHLIHDGEEGGKEAWETVKSAGGALFAENLEGGNWGVAEMEAEGSDEE